MTCFSIQKTLGLLLLLGFLSAGASSYAQEKPGVPDEGFARARPAPTTGEDVKSNAPIVVELYTTADCSACVFADRMLYDSMKDKNVIGLSCYIKDMKATQQGSHEVVIQQNANKPMDPCTFRQWTYLADSMEQDVTVRAPTFFINGYDQVDSIEEKYFDTVLDKYHYAGNNHVLEALIEWKDGDTLTIHLPQAEGNDVYKKNASVWLVRYKDMAVEKIETGINAGRVLRFSNIIQDIKHIAKWRGDARAIDVDVTPPKGGKEKGGYAVLVAELMGAPILAAGKISDYPMANDVKKPEAPAERPAESAPPQL